MGLLETILFVVATLIVGAATGLFIAVVLFGVDPLIRWEQKR